jgi:DNA-binding transcriptional LysR family regulator
MSDLDLRKLRYFVAVADELNYGRAAERLHIAQPVLSRQITALEHELGVALFARSKRGTQLTEAGLLLREDARALMLTAAALQRRARVAGREGQHFTVGFMPGVIVTPAVRLLAERFPGLRVDVVRTSWDDQVEMVHDGRVDASFVRPPVPRRGLTLIPLFREPRVVALPASHFLADRDVVKVADLVPLDLLQDPDAVPEWRDLVAESRPTGLSLDRVGLPRPRTVEEKLEHVASGRGVVVLPESTAMFYTRPDVVYRYVADLPPGEVALAFEARRSSPPLDALAQTAAELFCRESDSDVASPAEAPGGAGAAGVSQPGAAHP